jgi:hypothetical protein
MNDPTDARSKAEASYRLAELAKTPRARELFKQLAAEYESRANGELKAELIEQAEAAPSLVPAASLVSAPDEMPTADAPPVAPSSESEQWLANLAAIREQS